MSAVEDSRVVDRQALIGEVERSISETARWIRQQVVEHDRVDILAREVLGFEVKPFHFALQRFQVQNRETLQLAFRGAGKSTVLSTTFAISRIVQDPNVRILIASKTAGHAKSILREIKQHIAENEKFKLIFGDLVGEKWDEEEITVCTRSRPAKEPTIMTVGIGGQVVGKHFDVIICDDLVDEDNSRTQHMREKTKVWYYKVLHPTLEPHARLHIIGTRYHFDDLYGHLEATDLKDATQIIPALDDRGRSPWPEKYPAAFFKKKREQLGLIIFASQFLCNTEAMKGEVFQYDWIDWVEASQIPEDARIVGGIDLAIKESEQADRFAFVALKVDKGGHIWVIHGFTQHLTFSRQTAKILQLWRTGVDGWTAPPNAGNSTLHEFGIEINAYQAAQYQKLKEEEPTIRLVPITTLKDKMTRAWKLSAHFEAGKVHFVKGLNELAEQLVLFPNYQWKDLFDALDLAVTVAIRPRRRRKERGKVGVI